MKRTSLTHPLEIAALSAGPTFGRVGITFCPGKYDRHAMSGYWERDLSRDLDAIRDWGAAAVVTLVEQNELLLLRVEQLGEEVTRRDMLWFHLPIVDVSTPDEEFEQRWAVTGDALPKSAAQRTGCPGSLPRRARASWHNRSSASNRTRDGANGCCQAGSRRTSRCNRDPRARKIRPGYRCPLTVTHGENHGLV